MTPIPTGLGSDLGTAPTASGTTPQVAIKPAFSGVSIKHSRRAHGLGKPCAALARHTKQPGPLTTAAPPKRAAERAAVVPERR